MIREVDFLITPMEPGESRNLRVYAESPISVAIRCFVSNPPPPGYRACAECGNFTISSGETLEVSASRRAFAQGGQLEIVIVDAEGDQRSFLLSVESEARGESGGMMAAY